MPITKDVNNIITYQQRKATWEDELTGVYPSAQWRVGGDGDVTKQIGLDSNDQSPNTTVILKGNASTTTNITVTLPATSGTLSYSGGGGSTPSFSTIQTPAGTSPVATSSTDILTLTSTANSLVITGNAGTDTVNFDINTTTFGNGLVHPTTGSTYERAAANPGMTGTDNTAIGVGALDSLTTGSSNAGFGKNVLTAITTSSSNYAAGVNVAGTATSSDTSYIVGVNVANSATLFSNAMLAGVSVFSTSPITLKNTTAIGINIGANVTSNQNAGDTFIGQNILNGQNYSGLGNTFIGNDIATAATTTITSSQNVIIGRSAGRHLETGEQHTIIGAGAGGGLVNTVNSVVIGTSALSIADSSNSVVIGAEALHYAVISDTNVAIGGRALQYGNDVEGNIAIGGDAFLNASMDTLFNAIAIGAAAGTTCVSNGDIILIGGACQPSSNSSTSEFCVGGHDVPIATYILGSGGSPYQFADDILMQPTDVAGTNKAGFNFKIRSSRGTGTGGSGEIQFFTAPAGSTGTTQNTSTKVLSVDKNGNLRAYTLHNNATAQGSASNQDIRSGTYTPTVTNSTNTDSAVTATVANWHRVGNIVVVSGRFTADPTLAATATSLELSLPVASNIGVVEDLNGTAFCGSIASMGGEVIGVVATDTAKVIWVSSDVTSKTWSYMYQYEVI